MNSVNENKIAYIISKMVEKLFECIQLIGRSARLTFWLSECWGTFLKG